MQIDVYQHRVADLGGVRKIALLGESIILFTQSRILCIVNQAPVVLPCQASFGHFLHVGILFNTIKGRLCFVNCFSFVLDVHLYQNVYFCLFFLIIIVALHFDFLSLYMSVSQIILALKEIWSSSRSVGLIFWFLSIYYYSLTNNLMFFVIDLQLCVLEYVL